MGVGKKRKEEKETNHKKLLKIENKQGLWKEVGGQRARWVMGIRMAH